MSILFTVADERFSKRPSLYRNLGIHSRRIADALGYEPVLVFFGKAEALLQEIGPCFSRVFRFDYILLSDPESAAKAFVKIGFEKHAASAIFLHHSVYEKICSITTAPFEHSYHDIVDIAVDQEVSLFRPLLSFRYLQEIRLKDSFALFIRNLMSEQPLEAIPEGGAVETTYVKIPFTRRRQPRRNDVINSAFTIVGGEGLHDAKNYTRFIQSAGDKMKGAALASAALYARDHSLKEHVIAETKDTISSDFSIITGEKGSYDLMETALRQKYAVYIHDQPDPMMESAVDMVIPADPVSFFDIFVRKLRKITFIPKKISRK